jgi:hypothetical protein
MVIFEKEVWPKDMGALSNLTFTEVYNTNKGFVEFTREHIKEPTGTFKLWVEYLASKK